ncbi:NifB/NifX family molybdenum-iron cluster-binding protein [Thermochromatium tepidum]|uniref:Dinitrogenase iron-molybdenum cofactor biosynthesis domain-containing protein n=1 Tax=Thermochromatium tepidum ATCC 43061 TaxID=316276 RepID=A0A6I6ECX0_THETI|nr:NifB/NifX family molybdenum-iron cluster-binding protein [Thermochromatium tepidum]QGU33186.1 hypothetical protein E6P07_09490 [Thermochromatium tepidum ATCC 43061]
MPRPIRIACATESGRLIDGHFGSCRAFAIWDVGPDDITFIEARSTLEADESADRNRARAELIQDCQITYVQEIGGPAAAKVVRAGVHPLRVAPGTSMHAMLERLQQALRKPPPWLARVMGIEAASLARYRLHIEQAEEG